MEAKFPPIFSSLKRLCRSPIVCTGLRKFSCHSSFPDPPCIEPNPRCHYVKDSCREARDMISLKLPFDKHMLDLKRQKLEKLIEPPCCVLRSSHCNPCANVFPKRKQKNKEEPPPFRSMWEPHCTPRQQPYCPDMLPRFDDLYYSPSNKCRCFQRTWVECPPVKQRLKKVCCPDAIEPPEVQKRVKNPCSNCDLDLARMRKLCADKQNRNCPKMYWPCCKPVRCDVSCNSHHNPSKCKRLRAPYPCFSDRRVRHRLRRQKECKISSLSKCEVYALQNRREIFTLKNSLC